MERIKSFTINHNILKPGFYISRKDGEIVTYDLRTRKPNAGDYMTNSAMLLSRCEGCRAGKGF